MVILNSQYFFLLKQILGQSKPKFHGVLVEGEMELCLLGQAHMTKMAGIRVYGKTLQKFSLEPKSLLLGCIRGLGGPT